MCCSANDSDEVDSERLLSSATEKEANDSENELNPTIADYPTVNKIYTVIEGLFKILPEASKS